MDDRSCVALLAWALPRVGLRWEGFRNVRRQVCRRVGARLAELGDDPARYRIRLEADPAERAVFAALCHVTISRLYRDRGVFDALRATWLPSLAAAVGAGPPPRRLRVWSAGCASGEEPYTVAILWELELAERFPDVALEVVATDRDRAVLARARRAVYAASSLREVPAAWREAAFEPAGEGFAVRAAHRAPVTFVEGDIRADAPSAPLHLVLCRNAAFTYFDLDSQREFAQRVATRLAPEGLLVVGAHEALPSGAPELEPLPGARGFYRQRAGGSGSPPPPIGAGSGRVTS